MAEAEYTPMNDDDDDEDYSHTHQQSFSNLHSQMVMETTGDPHWLLKPTQQTEAYTRVMSLAVTAVDHRFDVVTAIICPPRTQSTFPMPKAQAGFLCIERQVGEAADHFS